MAKPNPNPQKTAAEKKLASVRKIAISKQRYTHKLVGPAAAEVEIKTPVTSDSIVLYLSSNGIQGCVTIHPVGGLPIFTEGDTWENQIQV